MNDILKYWPINFTYSGTRMSIPMGQITNIAENSNSCTVYVGGDSWTTDKKEDYDSIMQQWSHALARFSGVQPSYAAADRDGRPIL
jgi:hypothetical protein